MRQCPMFSRAQSPSFVELIRQCSCTSHWKLGLGMPSNCGDVLCACVVAMPDLAIASTHGGGYPTTPLLHHIPTAARPLHLRIATVRRCGFVFVFFFPCLPADPITTRACPTTPPVRRHGFLSPADGVCSRRWRLYSGPDLAAAGGRRHAGIDHYPTAGPGGGSCSGSAADSPSRWPGDADGQCTARGSHHGWGRGGGGGGCQRQRRRGGGGYQE